jgi:hypothetical protein
MVTRAVSRGRYSIKFRSACMHHDQVPARRRGHRSRHHNQVPATHNERRREQRPGHHDQVPREPNAGAGSNLAKAHIHISPARIQMTPPCNVAAFVVNSEPPNGAGPSVRLCLGPELARCVHYYVILNCPYGSRPRKRDPTFSFQRT